MVWGFILSIKTKVCVLLCFLKKNGQDLPQEEEEEEDGIEEEVDKKRKKNSKCSFHLKA